MGDGGAGKGHMVALGFAGVHACGVSPRLSEDRSLPSLCELSKVACWPSRSLSPPGSLYLCPELGLGGCQPVAGR